ncbi:MAG: type II secretion system protein [Candidatus Saccharibacteria bacterium]|nr:type II secretion system protein [Candidatus Saccharibacteria bacterium]
MTGRCRGFTIIEVMLFLAISGSLAVALLIGTSLAIQRQQYRDAVQSFAGFLSDQYAKVLHVENERTAKTCPLTGSLETLRGQSDCVIIGRYIASVGPTDTVDGSRYAAYPVYARKVGSTWRYALGEAAPYALNWGVKTRFSMQGELSARIALLMYRDPENGQIIMRANSGRYTSATIGEFIAGKSDSAATGDSQLARYEICVYDRGWFQNERRSVFIGARAGSSSAIQVGNATGACRDAA